jgi:hypothetical protein
VFYIQVLEGTVSAQFLLVWTELRFIPLFVVFFEVNFTKEYQGGRIGRGN